MLAVTGVIASGVCRGIDIFVVSARSRGLTMPSALR
jgi:hypothetical protein